jgi:acetyl-CoA synthetase
MRTRIRKQPAALIKPPNMLDYDAARRHVSWEAIGARLEGAGVHGMNIAHQAVDRHAKGEYGARTALRWLARAGGFAELSYAELARQSSRFANALQTARAGAGAGDVVCVLLDRIPEFHIALLGSLKAGCVVAPVQSDLDVAAVVSRLRLGQARVLVTSAEWLHRHGTQLRRQLPLLKRVIMVDAEGEVSLPVPGAWCIGWSHCMAAAADHFEIGPTQAHDLALLLFAEDVMGRTRGVLHAHASAMTWLVSGRYALDLQDDDVLWCTALPGSAIGTCYGALAPLICGTTVVVTASGLSPERFWQVLGSAQVTVCCLTPVALRMLMREPMEPDAPPAVLRLVASIGEPLTPGAVRWGERIFNRAIHDNWWQLEAGAVVVGNFAALDIKRGSVGRPLPGIEAAIVRRNARGDVCVADEPGVEGELALRAGWPSMMRACIGDESAGQVRILDGWYLTGTLARFDADGYLWMLSGVDEMIRADGKLLRPFEIESALAEHPEVVDAAVIGVSDGGSGRVVKAFVSLRNGEPGTEWLRDTLVDHVRRSCGSAAAPALIEFRAELPRTETGKLLPAACRSHPEHRLAGAPRRPTPLSRDARH